MKMKHLCKCLTALGLLLFFALLLPFSSFSVATAKAAVLNISTDKEKVESYRIAPTVILLKGKTQPLTVYNLGAKSKVSFKSDNSEIASVDKSGLITANKVGAAVITVIVKDGSTKTNLTCNVTVYPPAISVKWTKERVFLALNNDAILNVIMKPDNTLETASISSRDANIVYVRSGGRVSAKDIGMTYVFAEIDPNPDGSRRFATCTVLVASQADTPLLEAYFNSHSELYRINSDELNTALEDFFNGGSAKAAVAADGTSTLINDLDKFLEGKFKLSEIRAQMKAEAEAALSKNSTTGTTTDNQTKETVPVK